jgi:flagellar motor protein MotB
MMKHVAVMVVAGMMLSAAGCSNVQKGTTVQKGAAVGSAVGVAAGGLTAAASSAVSTMEGGIVGLGVGALAGALVADQYYRDDHADVIAQHAREMELLSGKLSAKEAELAAAKAALEEEKNQREAILEAYSKGLGKPATTDPRFGDNVIVTREPDGGLKLTILSEVLFASGKADLSAEGQKVLSQAAKTIKSDYPEYYIEVRGHTDNVPIRYSKFRSNWELSCERALSVLHFLLEKEQLPSERMMVAGFADTLPVASNDSAEGRRANRRAEIILHPKPVEVAAQ